MRGRSFLSGRHERKAFRQCGEADIQRILFVRRAKQMAFYLQEICELLLLQRERERQGVFAYARAIGAPR